jgi:hypothetical protein
MRVWLDQPKVLIWGPKLAVAWRKIYLMAEVTLHHITHSVFTSRPCDLDMLSQHDKSERRPNTDGYEC